MARIAIKEAPQETLKPISTRKHTPNHLQKEQVAGYVFLIPWFLGFIVFTIGPILGSLYLSFTHYDLLSAPRWLGLDNYINMFQDERWQHAVRVTIGYVFLSVPFKIAFALLLALILKRGLTSIGLYRAIYYVPSLLGGSVAIAILWRQIFDSDGVVNQFLRLFGIPANQSWIANPDYALSTLVLLSIWQFGSPMIIFLAGLKQIPTEYYEAAQTDGAGRLRIFFRITLPLLTPLIFFNLVMQMVEAFQAFTPAFIISNGQGSPLDSTLLYTLYVYQQGFGSLHMGYASAMAWTLLIAIASITALAFQTSRFWVFYQDERS
ncbi:carbohydrate ABC transporter permease [Ktedonospora formicarum]|uniref:ABC transporter permease n=1 Tax=Ktedonospora formicarum TaxID=2778364 RepID=A0A8J3I4W8_9CHLR|nr:sugar ABC transporter permease [Ktedonospora formicarum]GHO46222.1 ABC transporter permease [Ktedonospora formicarum]